MRIVLLGTPVTGEDCHSWGLVTEVFEPGSVLDGAISVASQLAEHSPMAMSVAKKAITRGKDSNSM
jgi:enoyl-CoA hydratase